MNSALDMYNVKMVPSGIINLVDANVIFMDSNVHKVLFGALKNVDAYVRIL